eukprot:1607385-Rhodomonas_salina.1
MDLAPPRLKPDLVKVENHSLRYSEQLGDMFGTSYQGVTRITDEKGGWDLDGMRWYQILKDELVKDSEGMRGQKKLIAQAEKR